MLYLLETRSAFDKTSHRKILDITPDVIQEIENWRGGNPLYTDYVVLEDLLTGCKSSYTVSVLSEDLYAAIPLDNPPEI